jgi:Domain of unknown function (DUF1918)
MPKPGDRIVIEGTKVGGGRREGTLLGMSGPLMRVKWEDGAESYMAPGAGVVRFLPGNAKSGGTSKTPTKKVTAKAAPAKAKGKKR